MMRASLPLPCFALLALSSTLSHAANDSGEWQKVWSDEFDVEGLPSEKRWAYEEGFIRNDEAQYYTVKRPENARVQEGLLIIEARQDGYKGHPVSSASLTTRGLASWTYGRIEVRARLPQGRGVWPAIWTLGDNIGQVGWPACGEIDIMEYVGYQPDTIHANIHTDAYNHAEGTGKGDAIEVADATSAMRVYAVEWTPKAIDFFVDDQKYFTFENDGADNDATWPFHRPQHLKLNLAIGGSWGGQQGIDDAIFPAVYEIDYVRVYQRKD